MSARCRRPGCQNYRTRRAPHYHAWAFCNKHYDEERKKRHWASFDQKRKLSVRDLQRIHYVYSKGELSIVDIAEQVWRRYGYASRASCAQTIYSSLKKQGYTFRTQSEAAALWQTRWKPKRGRPRLWTRDQVLGAGVIWLYKHGGPLTVERWRASGVRPSAMTVIRRCGRWQTFRAAVQAAA